MQGELYGVEMVNTFPPLARASPLKIITVWLSWLVISTWAGLWADDDADGIKNSTDDHHDGDDDVSEKW